MKNYLFLPLVLILILHSCNLSDNTNSSNNPAEATTEQLFNSAISQMAFNQTSIVGRAASIIANYVGESQQPKQSTIIWDTESFENSWSNGFYTGSIAAIQKLRLKAIEEENTDLEGIANILLAYEYGNLTSLFGDIPYDKSFGTMIDLSPRYLTQEELYQELNDLIDEGIALIENSGTNSQLSSYDIVYNGDISLWTKFAHGIKARTLINQRNKVPGTNSEILDHLEKSFTNRDEQAEFQFSNDIKNPLRQINIERADLYGVTGSFGTKLKDANDPRFYTYTTGIASTGADLYYSMLDGDNLVWARENTTLPLLSYAEILFSKAEIMSYMGASTLDLSEITKDAISANLEDNEISPSASYVQSFLMTSSNLDNLSSEEISHKIIEQAYNSYFGYNFIQSWNNMRRTGIPDKILPTVIPHDYNPSGELPLRLLYPQSEYIYNMEELQKAIDRQDGALLDDPIWIFE